MVLHIFIEEFKWQGSVGVNTCWKIVSMEPTNFHNFEQITYLLKSYLWKWGYHLIISNMMLLPTITLLSSGVLKQDLISLHSKHSLGFPCGSAGKESTCNAGDLGSIPWLGRSHGEGKGYSLQYSGLENSMDCIVHGVAKSQIWLSNFHIHTIKIEWNSNFLNCLANI